MSKVFDIFPTPLGTYSYDSLGDVEYDYVKTLKYNSRQGDVFSSENTFVLNEQVMTNLKAFITKSINSYIKEVFNSNNTLQISQSWVNKLTKHSKFNSHLHNNSILSAVYYFEDTSSCPIVFTSPFNTYNTYGFSRLDWNIYNSSNYILPCKKNTLLIFPSQLVHRVDTHELDKDEKRFALACNTQYNRDEIYGSVEMVTGLKI